MSTAGQPIVCKAAVAWKAKEELVIEDVEVAPPKAGEVRVRIVSSAVCHTDAYTWSGADPEGLFPCILGHEGAGVVESVGEGVTSVAVGDHVVPLYTPQCDTCVHCRSTGAKRTNLCSRIRATQGRGVMPDGTSRFTSVRTREPIFHFMGCSVFSEYTVVPEIALAVMPAGARFDRTCLLGCGVTTGLGAPLHTARVEAGSTAAVFGLGAVGLAVVLGLKRAGCRTIIAVDLNPAKFDVARRLGGDAVVCLNPADPAHGGKPVAQLVVDMTTEEGFGGVDYSFECVGSVKLMRDALECTHRGWGVSVVIGVAASGQEIATRPFQLVTGRTWKGTAFGGVRGRTELPGLAAEYAAGALPLDEFVTHSFSGVAAINDAMHVMHDAAANALRPVITY